MNLDIYNWADNAFPKSIQLYVPVMLEIREELSAEQLGKLISLSIDYFNAIKANKEQPPQSDDEKVNELFYRRLVSKINFGIFSYFKNGNNINFDSAGFVALVRDKWRIDINFEMKQFRELFY